MIPNRDRLAKARRRATPPAPALPPAPPAPYITRSALGLRATTITITTTKRNNHG